MLILLGLITGAHGIKGEVKLKSFTADPAAINRYGPLLTKSGEAFEIVRLKPQKDHFIASLKGVTDRNRAEALRGTELFIARENLPPTDESELYIADLIGRSVEMNGAIIGEVTGVENYGAGDLLDVKVPGRRDSVLIPLAGDFISSIANTTITVDLPEGYLDEETKP